MLLLECQDRSGDCLWRKWLAPSSFGHIGTATEYQHYPDYPNIEETFKPAVQLKIAADESVTVWALQLSANIEGVKRSTLSLGGKMLISSLSMLNLYHLLTQ
jgi:hypothetical protein